MSTGALEKARAAVGVGRESSSGNARTGLLAESLYCVALLLLKHLVFYIYLGTGVLHPVALSQRAITVGATALLYLMVARRANNSGLTPEDFLVCGNLHLTIFGGVLGGIVISAYRMFVAFQSGVVGPAITLLGHGEFDQVPVNLLVDLMLEVNLLVMLLVVLVLHGKTFWGFIKETLFSSEYHMYIPALSFVMLVEFCHAGLRATLFLAAPQLKTDLEAPFGDAGGYKYLQHDGVHEIAMGLMFFMHFISSIYPTGEQFSARLSTSMIESLVATHFAWWAIHLGVRFPYSTPNPMIGELLNGQLGLALSYDSLKLVVMYGHYLYRFFMLLACYHAMRPTSLMNNCCRVCAGVFGISAVHNVFFPAMTSTLWWFDMNTASSSMVPACQVFIALIFAGVAHHNDPEDDDTDDYSKYDALRVVVKSGAAGMLFMGVTGLMSSFGLFEMLPVAVFGKITFDFGLMTYAALGMGLFMLFSVYIEGLVRPLWIAKFHNMLGLDDGPLSFDAYNVVMMHELEQMAKKEQEKEEKLFPAAAAKTSTGSSKAPAGKAKSMAKSMGKAPSRAKTPARSKSMKRK